MRLVLALIATFLAVPAIAQNNANIPNPSFILSNRGNQAINELYATPAGVDRWGRDRLGQNSLSPGQTFPVRLPADGNCIYDIRVVYADGKPEERRRLNTCQTETIVFPGGRPAGSTTTQGNSGQTNPGAGTATDDPSFRLVNRSRSEVNQVYVSLPTQENWGRDRLGDDTVAAGGTRVIRLPTGECTYDVRVVFANGEATEKRRLNLCAITDLRVP